MTVHVITTGGTIASHWDGERWTEIDGATLIAELGELPADVDVIEAAAGPSSNLSVEDMVGIAERVRSSLDQGAEGVVVVHGTDTMELTAFVTQLCLGTDTTRRPVVFTGAMRAHSHPRPDGARNVVDAVTAASSLLGVGHDVMVCMDGRLHAASAVRKVSAASVDAFDSFPLEPVGAVNQMVTTVAGPSAQRPAARQLVGPVPIVGCYPGMGSDVFDSAAAGAPAVVIVGFGDLNVPRNLWRSMRSAADGGALVVVASDAFTASIGDDAMRDLGIVGAGGLTPQKARLATMAALGSTSTRDDAISFLHSYALAHDAGDRNTTP